MRTKQSLFTAFGLSGNHQELLLWTSRNTPAASGPYMILSTFCFSIVSSCYCLLTRPHPIASRV